MIRALLFLPLALLVACRPGPANAPESTAPESESAPRQVAPVDTYFPLQVGERLTNVQLAITDTEMATGLMHRQNMPEHDGMIFVFAQPRPQRFWMRNTYIPLDIAYITPDGVIQEIHQMEPLDESGAPSSRADIQFALEMNQGWFEAYGVEVGDQIDLRQLASHVHARGFDSETITVQ
ncbi:MAG: DUF192 domain-containing protein [Puniceicoccales bacterium]